MGTQFDKPDVAHGGMPLGGGEGNPQSETHHGDVRRIGVQ